MIPSRRCYLLLAAGGLGAALLDIFTNRQVSLNFLRVYNFVLLIATVVDASQIKDNAVEVSREEIQKLSVGRDNAIALKITSQNKAIPSASFAIARIRDAYPPEFQVDKDTIEIELPANSVSEQTYIIHPDSPWGI